VRPAARTSQTAAAKAIGHGVGAFRTGRCKPAQV
jgi:hypothetical protein